jgi:hypothetical protein
MDWNREHPRNVNIITQVLSQVQHGISEHTPVDDRNYSACQQMAEYACSTILQSHGMPTVPTAMQHVMKFLTRRRNTEHRGANLETPNFRNLFMNEILICNCN